MVAHFLTDSEYSFLKQIEREHILKVGQPEPPPPDPSTVVQWLEVVSTAFSTVHGKKLYPARPVLWNQSGDLWDRFSPVWVRGPRGVETFHRSYVMGRMFATHTDGKPVFVAVPNCGESCFTGTSPTTETPTVLTGTAPGPAHHAPPCCSSVPSPLTVTITNSLNCACLAGSYEVHYSSSLGHWTSDVYSLCGKLVTFRLRCDKTVSGSWLLNIICNDQMNDAPMDNPYSCDPFSVTDLGKLVGAGGCCTGSVNVYITE